MIAMFHNGVALRTKTVSKVTLLSNKSSSLRNFLQKRRACSAKQQRSLAVKRVPAVAMSNIDPEGEPEGSLQAFTGKIGQSVRQGMQGWDTTIAVEQPGSKDDDLKAADGDTVTVEFTCTTTEDEEVASTKEDGPITFEIGTREFMGNPLFQGIDTASRGLTIGESATITAVGGEYQKDLLFAVPLDHPEVQRLVEEHGELKEGNMVKLVNEAQAVVVKVNDDVVMLDTNHPLAGAPLTIKLKLLSIDQKANESS
ncbi:hypothetical protein CYMTET_45921 [Cymbomonas tetramitiformis]|uniref:peptidylprolyl isomerase n=1 Tax=Cymbomonas tetramitiformis TaxID=36881 RepID=A0AAE0BX83_9CHLO|nr:hypothetical protein CYMTET_45921 [Cymbomonas tetramitiformis]